MMNMDADGYTLVRRKSKGHRKHNKVIKHQLSTGIKHQLPTVIKHYLPRALTPSLHVQSMSNSTWRTEKPRIPLKEILPNTYDAKKEDHARIRQRSLTRDVRRRGSSTPHPSSDVTTISSQRGTRSIDADIFDKRDFFFSDYSRSIRKELRMDKVASYSVTDMHSAAKISKFIQNQAPTALSITDGTACIGGNVISFATYFKHVTAIEFDKTRYEMLVHNLKVLKRTNVKCLIGDYTTMITTLQQDIVFLDPPWGGPKYKKGREKLTLTLGNVLLHDICETLKRMGTWMVVLKLPLNCNLDGLVYETTGKVSIHRHFRKMLLVTVDYRNQDEEEIVEQMKQQLKIS